MRFNEIVILTGQRPLSSHERLELSVADKFPATEKEMVLRVLEEFLFPKEWENFPLMIVDTPMKINSLGERLRPQTEDTFLHWLKNDPQPGSCLIVSSQPAIDRQGKVAKSVLYAIETIGPGVTKRDFFDEENTIDVFLDELARLLYGEKKILSL